MTTYKSATEIAKSIREELKRKQISSRQVSVTSEYFSMGQAVRVSIKNESVNPELVKSIAEPYSRIDRDSFGEILGGGNTYITIDRNGYSI
mgnify:CR=1 FL=1|jgi:histidinol-phosphate/aromatic aminotransferase/cobyric acid decarboxylase-like protein